MSHKRTMTPREIARKRRGGKAAKKALESRYGPGGSGIHMKRKGEWKR